MVVKSKSFGAKQIHVWAWFCHLLTLWPQASYWTSLSFLVHTMGRIIEFFSLARCEDLLVAGSKSPTCSIESTLPSPPPTSTTVFKDCQLGCLCSQCTVWKETSVGFNIFRILKWLWSKFLKLQFSSVTQSCPTLCDSMNRSTPGLPVHHQLLEFTQTHVHRVSDAIQPSHPLSPPSPPAPNPSQHQSLFQWVNSSHEVAKVLEFQL